MKAELAETAVSALPDNPDVDMLQRMRVEACTTSSSTDFKLQSQQRFLRRVLSPDSPTQSLLMVHGTGTGKTCTAIQIAEEYIIRPEFQDKKVLVLANPSVQDNFVIQLFDVDRVDVDEDGVVSSKQCTGRRYLESVMRSMPSSLRSADAEDRQRMRKTASKIINEFYEFQGYTQFANKLDEERASRTPKDFQIWIQNTYSNRLILVDEAHNLRDTSETESNGKLSYEALKSIVQTATGVTLVLMTATPMYDTYEEILGYFDLFLMNERKKAVGRIFNPDGSFADEETFRELCHSYVSFVRGENPFTFPFRLPPPKSMIASPDGMITHEGKKIEPRKYLELCEAKMSEYQESVVKSLQGEKKRGVFERRTTCVYPDNKDFSEVFRKNANGHSYIDEKFLAPSNVAKYSAKFASIMECIEKSTGVVFVFSNVVEDGAQLFSMCLEEHGFESVMGTPLLTNKSGETKKKKGKYALFTSANSSSEIKRMLSELRSRDNKEGKRIRVIVASPKVSEGVDFRFVRQIHILDPWFNMSRLEQVIGRGMRTCSHSMLDFHDQNCTVYLHVCRSKTSNQEMLDEYIYREIVEKKAIKIAKVKSIVMEAAMDCDLQLPVNSLSPEWMGLSIPQTRSQNNESIEIRLREAMAPTFAPVSSVKCDTHEDTEDAGHVRPLSAILDVNDEVLDTLVKLFAAKPVWKQSELAEALKPYDPSIIKYLTQNAIDSGFSLKDSNNRVGHLETKKGVVAFRIGPHDTMQDRIVPKEKQIEVSLEVQEAPAQVAQPAVAFGEYRWEEYASGFSDEVKKWYYLDQVLTAEQRLDYLKKVVWSSKTLPIYLSQIRIDDTHVAIGYQRVLDTESGEVSEPIGDDKDAYKAWEKELIRKFGEVSSSDSYFAVVKESGGVVGFNVEAGEESMLKPAKRTKSISGYSCTSYNLGVMKLIGAWLSGDKKFKFPPSSEKTKPTKCDYLSLLSRKCILESKEKFVWWTPEEWKVLSSPEVKSALRDATKQK